MDKASSQLIEALQHSTCYPHPVRRVILKETHISWILLTGQYVYKIKKPVLFTFVDFSTLRKRHWFCEEEVRLNRRLAPQLYLGVVPVTGSPSNPQMEGKGSPIEFAVKMKQFLPDHEFSKLLPAGKIDASLVSHLADCIGHFHTRIEQAQVSSSYGMPDVVWQSIEECFGEIPLGILPLPLQQSVQQIKDWTRKEWVRRKPVLEQRKSSRFIRECHGDLHLGNIALSKGQVCVFDALEFEPCLRWIDVISEAAFLVMDLESKDRVDLAYVFLNRYLEVTGDYGGMAVFRLYEVYRALVRAKVAGLRVAQVLEGSRDWEYFCAEMITYVELAHRLISSSSPVLIIMHGISGTGKTTISTEVVKTLGAIRVRSDVERKRISSEKDERGTREKDSEHLYAPDMTQATYDQLLDVADIMLRSGYSIVVDATFLRVSQRQPFFKLAQNRHVSFVILDIWAPEETLAERIALRAQQGGDASDATVAIMERQRVNEEPLTEGERFHSIGINSTEEESIQSAIRKLMKPNEKKHS
jgi:uncharacterized protein